MTESFELLKVMRGRLPEVIAEEEVRVPAGEWGAFARAFDAYLATRSVEALGAFEAEARRLLRRLETHDPE